MSALVRYFTIALLFCVLIAAASGIHAVGSPGNAPMDDYFIDNGQEQTGANSIISAVLFDYRGMDTLGEASVLFAAASGILIVFRRLGKDE